MKCQDYTNILEEYLDGELDERAAQELNAHLAACIACASVYGELQGEQEFYARYEREVTITPRMWNGVRDALAIDKATADGSGLFRRTRQWVTTALAVPRFSPALTAALVLVAIVATIGVMRLMGAHETAKEQVAGIKTGASTTPTSAPPIPASSQSVTNNSGENQANEAVQDKIAVATNRQPVPVRKNIEAGNNRASNVSHRATGGINYVPVSNNANLEQTPDQLVREAEQKYLAAIEMLSRDVNRRRTQLDPKVLARFNETLASIDRTIADTRRAALKQSSDPIAVQYMLTAYAKKVEVLREMAHD